MFQAIIAVRPLTLVMGKISYEDKARIETLRKLGFGYRTHNNCCTISGKRLDFAQWKQSVNGLMSVGQQRNGSGWPKTARTEENVRYLKLLISENRTLTLMPSHFTEYYVNWVKLNWLLRTYVINKCGKFCIKILLHYMDIAIFAFGYFSCVSVSFQFFSLNFVFR